ALMRTRAQIGAESVMVIANITAGFSQGIDTRPVTQRATGAVFVGLADAVCVGGAAAGVEANLPDLEQVARSVPTTPVVVGTGVSEENIAGIARVAHGSIVGTSIKFDRQTLNAVDPQRAKRFVAALRG
ncbi:MAG: SgcQ protein, partial [Haliea sp.]